MLLKPIEGLAGKTSASWCIDKFGCQYILYLNVASLKNWKILGQFSRIYFSFFLASFAAFFSFGDNAGFFFSSRLFLNSLLVLLAPGFLYGYVSNNIILLLGLLWYLFKMRGKVHVDLTFAEKTLFFRNIKCATLEQI